MSLNSRSKGRRGEYEVRDLLQGVVNAVCAELNVDPLKIDRNVDQARYGGADISCIPWLAIEVKYREQVQVDQWWEQTKRQAKEGQEPVLVWRSNGQRWRCRMFGYLIAGPAKVRCPVDVPVGTFLVWFRERFDQWARGA